MASAFNILAGIAAIEAVGPTHRDLARESKPKRNNSIAEGNRHGGPHLHLREIARRQRQQARKQEAA